METSIPDALEADLRDYFLAAQPGALALPEGSVRVKIDTAAIVSPRLVFQAGEPKPRNGMDGTARIPIEIEYVTSLDAVSETDDHRETAAIIDAWLRSIRSVKRRDVVATRIYLHDIYTLHPVTSIRAAEREQSTKIRGEVLCTLVAI
jgi:hypothetical protein